METGYDELIPQFMNQHDLPKKDLVLIGGGHSHVAVLKHFGMRPLDGTRVTLISKSTLTPYSGMLPGFLAGHYSFDQIHIDLAPLAAFAKARFFTDEVVGLDPVSRLVHCKRRPPVHYDVLSIDTGSTPNTSTVPGAAEHACPVKPIDRFVRNFERILDRLQQIISNRPYRIVVVGSGAGGIELCLSVRHRLLHTLASRMNGCFHTLEFHLVGASEKPLSTHSPRAQRALVRILRERKIACHWNHRVMRVEPSKLICQGDKQIPFDTLFWVTDASAPMWPGHGGLAVDEKGFIQVNASLQSISHPEVFAAGDVAHVVPHPRPKSGVFAVRQGEPLAGNLRRALASRTLETFRPQKTFLSIISTGDRHAVASRGPFAWEGDWVWRWKDWIDRRWMLQYQKLPEMEGQDQEARHFTPELAGPERFLELSKTSMRCGGCGAKVGHQLLDRVLSALPKQKASRLQAGLEAIDDAAVIFPPPGKLLATSIDFFRPLLNDPWLFGRIAAIHCLNDLVAKGATPHSALALCVIPHGQESKQEELLQLWLGGAIQELNRHGATLVGGHTAEGAEPGLGFCVQGWLDDDGWLRKADVEGGQAVILTKPIGTGTLFAAHMRAKAKGIWVEEAVEIMVQSNLPASAILREGGATACTDVTGFGLVGHLFEMLRPGAFHASINLDRIPVLRGAHETSRAGILSTLHPQNARLHRAIGTEEASLYDHDSFPLLFDPQTAGGLLATVPEENAGFCVDALRQEGFACAAVIGSILGPDQEPRMTLVRSHWNR